jgi:hypothetical protein
MTMTHMTLILVYTYTRARVTVDMQTGVICVIVPPFMGER